MDRNLREDLKKVAQAERLKNEEVMHGERIGAAFVVSEDVEDKYEIISSLTKKLKIWRGILITGIITLILILLYVIYVFTRPPVEEPIVEPVLTQNVVDVNLYMKLEAPEVNAEDIKTITLAELAENYDFIAYKGVTYYDINGSYISVEDDNNIEMPEATVYDYDCLEKLAQAAKRSYSFTDEKFNQSYKDNNLPINVAYNDGDAEKFEFYDSDETAEKSDLIVQADTVNEFTITFYEDVDENTVKEIVDKALSQYSYSDSLRGISLAEAISEISDKYDCDDVTYYDSTRIDENGNMVGSKDGVEEIPETIINYTITEVEVNYNILALAYYNGWY